MCGIFGFAGTEQPERLERAARLMTHRGPDGFGVLNDPGDPLFLAHCRLAIIDLSERGRQPMSNETGDVWITFNGEIYNFQDLRAELLARGHQFRSSTDTEVIIHAYEEWGDRCVERLHGMFAFGIWDRPRRRLFLARDRVGIKPLYWFQYGSRFGFASELKSLQSVANVGDRMSATGLASFLSYGYITGAESIWQGVSRLLPGHTLSYDLRQHSSRIQRYWSLSENARPTNAEDATDKLENLLRESVRSHLVSDVPVSLFLSGGLDSSLVAAFAAELSPSVSATTVEFSGWDRNEGAVAAELCEYKRISHQITRVTEDDFSQPEQILRILDEPIADSAVFSTNAVCSKSPPQAKVVLSGDGGDELFGGYGWYRSLISTPRRELAFIVERIRRKLGWGRPWPEGCGDWVEYHQLITSPGFTAGQAMDLIPVLKRDAFDVVRERFVGPARLGGFRRWQEQDFHTYLVDNNLARMDRISMHHSLEVRVPLLDHRIVELAYSLPERDLINGDEQKVILRRVARRHLPQSLLDAPKRGFSRPVESLWPTERMVGTVRRGTLRRDGWLHGSALDKFLDAPRQGTWWFRLWLLAVLEIWSGAWRNN